MNWFQSIYSKNNNNRILLYKHIWGIYHYKFNCEYIYFYKYFVHSLPYPAQA